MEYECECQYETEHGTGWVTRHDLRAEMESARYEWAHVSEHDFHHELRRQVFVLVFREQKEQVQTQVLQVHVFYRMTTTASHFDWAALQPSVHGCAAKKAIGKAIGNTIGIGVSNEKAQSPYEVHRD